MASRYFADFLRAMACLVFTMSVTALAGTMPPGLTSDTVVVDRIVIGASPASSVTPELLTSYFDLPLGRQVTRDEMQEHLSRLKLRLEALAYFSKIDLRLERGDVRNHFVVVVDLETASATYAGIGATASKGRRRLSFLNFESLSHQESLFAGSRDIAGTGLMIDAEVRHTDEALKSFFATRLIGNAVTATLFHPGIAGSPYVAGLKLYVGRNQATTEISADDDSPDEGSAEPSPSQMTSRIDLWGYEALVGRRFGMMTVSVANSRIGERTTGATDFGFASNYLGLQFNYSAKSYLAAIEPGTTAKLEFGESFTSVVGKLPLATGSLDHTVFVASHQALTPKFKYTYTDKSGLVPGASEYQGSVLYQWVSPWDWVFGVEPKALSSAHQSPAYAAEASAKFVSRSFLVSLSLVGGTQGYGTSQGSDQRGVMP